MTKSQDNPRFLTIKDVAVARSIEPVAGGQPRVKRAHLVDLLPLSWNTALAFSRGKGSRTYWRKRAQAVLMVPIFVLLFLMYMPAGDVITTPSRDAVILLTEARNTKKTLQRVGSMAIVFFGALFAFVIWLFALMGLGDSVEPWVGLLWPAWFVIGLLLVASSIGGGGSVSVLVEALATRPRGSYWVAQALASAPGAQCRGLDFAKAAIETFVPVETPVVATAASEKTAVIYERFGFVRQKPGSLNLTRQPLGCP
ncbi:hypothetical protein [uncultured Arthrobacter sp.]|uniref:hypothetical protein n=1 Tax=uncultured Arthrobacter sp. TaxID=114050 RepID=UPI00260ACDE6|nr:hypothetical protein [uncultured Arthrobacter sp.]